MLPLLLHRQLCSVAGSFSRSSSLFQASGSAELSNSSLVAGSSNRTASSSGQAAVSGKRGHGVTSSAASSSSSVDAGVDWTKHSSRTFSIRPSFLSPLQGVYRTEAEREERRALISTLLAANKVLADEIDGLDSVQILRTTRHRIEQTRELSKDFEGLLTRPNVSRCDRRDLVFGYYSLLEQSAAAGDKDAQTFHEVSEGRVHPWTYWAKHFAEKYSSVPGLEPLEAIYARTDPINVLSEMKARSDAQLSSGAQSGAGEGAAEPSRLSPSNNVDADGAAHSLGRRKTSFARVTLVKGSGRITVNGSPLNEYFLDIATRAHVLRPMVVTQSLLSYDVVAETQGGGFSGQAQALRTGVARALAMQDSRYGSLLGKLMRWDGRSVERKKPGQKKARKNFTWVKR